jgi:hypothetical protein
MIELGLSGERHFAFPRVDEPDIRPFCAPPTGLVAGAVQFAIWRRGTRRLSPPQFLDAQFRPQPTETVICNRIVAAFGPCRTIFEHFKPIGDFDSPPRVVTYFRAPGSADRAGCDSADLDCRE